ncbi:MAG: hypothetical protein AAGC44_03225 [Planctomycetota bacterium]
MSLQLIILLIIFLGPFLLRVIAKYGEWQKKSAQRNRGRDREELDGTIRFDQGDVSANTQQPDPANMTMAQRIELARQRAQQQADPRQARLEAQRRAQQEAQRQAQADALRRQQQQVDAQRRQQAAAREQARRRQAQEQARRQPQPQQRSTRGPTSRPTQGQPPVARPVTRQQKRAAGQRRKQQPKAVTSKAEISNSPIVAPQLRTSRGGRRGVPTVLDGVSLKQAFVLKELLDRPLALRDDREEFPA